MERKRNGSFAEKALKSLGFQNKHDTELNQWMKEVLAGAKEHGIEWKGSHEEHLDVYNFKKKRTEKGSTEIRAGERVSNCRKRRMTAQSGIRYSIF